MNGIGWITVAEAARLCGTDELRITLWMNGNHIAYARFDGILMIDGASLAALFSRNRVATIYEDVAQQRGKPGRPGRLRRLLDTPLDAFGLSQRIVRACRYRSLSGCPAARRPATPCRNAPSPKGGCSRCAGDGAWSVSPRTPPIAGGKPRRAARAAKRLFPRRPRPARSARHAIRQT